jgi:hypothetical protein
MDKFLPCMVRGFLGMTRDSAITRATLPLFSGLKAFWPGIERKVRSSAM